MLFPRKLFTILLPNEPLRSLLVVVLPKSFKSEIETTKNKQTFISFKWRASIHHSALQWNTECALFNQLAVYCELWMFVQNHRRWKNDIILFNSFRFHVYFHDQWYEPLVQYEESCWNRVFDSRWIKMKHHIHLHYFVCFCTENNIIIDHCKTICCCHWPKKQITISGFLSFNR